MHTNEKAVTAHSLPNTNGDGQSKNPAFAGFFESGRPDLNRGPHRPERCALPGCATPRRVAKYRRGPWAFFRPALGRDGLVIANREPGHHRLEALFQGQVVLVRVAPDPEILDRGAL